MNLDHKIIVVSNETFLLASVLAYQGLDPLMPSVACIFVSGSALAITGSANGFVQENVWQNVMRLAKRC